MRFRTKQVASHVIPLAILSFFLVSLEVSFQCFDGPGETRVGFPLGFITPSLVSSMEVIVDAPALAIDACVYLGVWLLLSGTSLFNRFSAWHPRLVSICLWILAGLLLGFYVMMLSDLGHAGGVTFDAREDCTKVISYRIHVGPP